MENPFDEMKRALEIAQQTNRAVDNHSNSMAHMIRGRLRSVWNRDVLRDIKKELRDFDMVTGNWKSRS